MTLRADIVAYMQNKEAPERLGLSSWYLRDLAGWPELVARNAIALTVEGHTYIGNFDKIREGWNQYHEVELVQVRHVIHPRHFGSSIDEDEIENTIVLPSHTQVTLLPRLTGDTHTYIFNEQEDSMSRQNDFMVDKHVPYTGANALPGVKIHTNKVNAASADEASVYLELSSARTDGLSAMLADVFLGDQEVGQLIENLTRAKGVDQALELDYDIDRDQEIFASTTLGKHDDEIICTTEATITEDVALAQLNHMAQVYQHLVSKRKKEGELFARVDAFRKQLKPNAKKFQPTAELPEQARDFQIARFKRVTGWVETELNKDKEDPTA